MNLADKQVKTQAEGLKEFDGSKASRVPGTHVPPAMGDLQVSQVEPPVVDRSPHVDVEERVPGVGRSHRPDVDEDVSRGDDVLARLAALEEAVSRLQMGRVANPELPAGVLVSIDQFNEYKGPTKQRGLRMTLQSVKRLDFIQKRVGARNQAVALDYALALAEAQLRAG